MGVFTELKWKDAGPSAADLLFAQPAADLLPGSRLDKLFEVTGTVLFPPGTTPQQKAVILLHAAAEVEHQFIVQYLYAQYCGGPPLQALSAEERKALPILAKEEMGHLITVQNLLLMLGERPYLERLREITSDQEPSPFKLEALNVGFIARFLIAESSTAATLPAGIGQHLPPDLPLQQIHHVGAIYAMIYWLFQSDAPVDGPWTIPLGTDMSALQDLGHLTDDDLADPEAVKAKLSRADDWGATGHVVSSDKNILVMPEPDFTDKTSMRMAALTAIHTLAGQGEGPVTLPTGTPEKTHAQRLTEIYDRLTSFPDGAPELDNSLFPADPYTRPQSGDPTSEPNLIAGDAAVKADALDRSYEKILLTIALNLVAEDPNARSESAGDAVATMFQLGGLAKELVKLPRKVGDVSLLAAPPFTFPASIPLDEAQIRQRLLEIG